MQSADEGLRVAVMCTGTTVPAWQARCLEALFAVAGVEPVVVIVDTASGPIRGWARRVARRSLALRSVDAHKLLAGLPSVPFGDDALHAVIGPRGLDVVLHLSPSSVPAPLVRIARRGVWSLHTGGDRADGGGAAPGFWEIVHGAPVTSAALHCRREPDAATELIGEAFFRTRAHSYVRTLDDVLFGAAALPARACRTILAGGEPLPGGAPARASSAHPPTRRDRLTLAARLGVNFMRGQLSAILLSPLWNVGEVDAPIHRFLEPSFEPPVRWRPDAPRGHFVADPFALQDGKAREWLVESYDYGTDRGVIVAVDPALAGTERESVLPVDTHASYPYLLRHRGEAYCVPQLDGTCGVRIFRAVAYPTEWEDAGVLVADVDARDPTLFQYEGRWWLAYTDASAPLTDLHIWWADDLFGQWRPHAANPVKIDARSARPAGTPFLHAGTLYRPAQDCSHTYGGAVAICRVGGLTPTDFREEVVRVVTSLKGPYRRGIHTLASAGDTTLVDGKRLSFNLAGSRRAIRSRLQRTSA